MITRSPLPTATARWPTHDGSLEHILSLKPDVVLVGEFNALLLRQRLMSLGVRVVMTRLPTTLDEVKLLSDQVAALLGREAANASWPVVPPTSPVARHGQLLLLGANGFGAGRGTLEDSLLTQAGWTNYVHPQGHVSLDLEALSAQPPDAVVWSTPRHAALANQFAQHPVLQRAVPPHRWIRTDDWRWRCPGPWMVALLAQLQP